MKSRLIPDGSGRDQRRQPEPQNVEELLLRAQALAGFSVGALAGELGFLVPSDNVRSKGFVGQLVERALGADPKAGELPDFPNLGVELKTIPLRADGKPSESTFVPFIWRAPIEMSGRLQGFTAGSRMCFFWPLTPLKLRHFLRGASAALWFGSHVKISGNCFKMIGRI